MYKVTFYAEVDWNGAAKSTGHTWGGPENILEEDLVAHLATKPWLKLVLVEVEQCRHTRVPKPEISKS